MLIVSSGKDDKWLAREAGEKLEAIHARHLDIKKKNVDIGCGAI